MKRFIFGVFISIASLSAWGEPSPWFTDVRAAQDKARRENKAVLLDFTGSDWCGWCMRLKSEVFDTPEFAAFAKANLVLVEVDFPRRKAMSPAQTDANNRLAQTFQIEGYPTIVILDRNGNKLGNTGYLPGGPRAFNAEITRILKATGATVTVPAPAAPPGVTNYYGSLALKAISGTGEKRMVLINNATFVVGETAMVKVKDQRLQVVCKEIRDDSVLITVDGKPLELTLRNAR